MLKYFVKYVPYEINVADKTRFVFVIIETEVPSMSLVHPKVLGGSWGPNSGLKLKRVTLCQLRYLPNI